MMTILSDYETYDGLGLAELLYRGEVTPLDLVEEAIRRVEDLNPALNAIIEKTYDQGRAVAESAKTAPGTPFRGIPFFIKDLMAAQEGVPLRCGSRLLRDIVSDHDSEIVNRYRRAGVIPIGRTNTPEFGLMPVTEPALFGPTRNPWDLRRTPGGSSGGSAAAVAARIVPIAHGNDGAGSIRIPAACCGLFGLKPTRGRTPIGPDMVEAWQGLACDHVLTRSVRDSAAMLDATAGPEPGGLYHLAPPDHAYLKDVTTEPGRLRIAVSARPLVGALPERSVHADCVRALEDAAQLCEELGHDVIEAAPDLDGQAFATAFLLLVAAEVGADIAKAERFNGRKAGYHDVEAITWALKLLSDQTPARALAQATRTLHATGPAMATFFESYDLLMTPTLARPPIAVGSLQLDRRERLALEILGRVNAAGLLHRLIDLDEVSSFIFDFIPYTPLANASGCPAMSVPLYWNADNLPIGVHVVAPFGDEAPLFRLAGQLERARPWFDRAPPTPTSP